MKIVTYEHFGTIVSAFDRLKGKHKEHCLCWQQCKFFKPNTKDNCKIAQKNYELDVYYHVVTPVFECPIYRKEAQ